VFRHRPPTVARPISRIERGRSGTLGSARDSRAASISSRLVRPPSRRPSRQDDVPPSTATGGGDQCGARTADRRPSRRSRAPASTFGTPAATAAYAVRPTVSGRHRLFEVVSAARPKPADRNGIDGGSPKTASRRPGLPVPTSVCRRTAAWVCANSSPIFALFVVLRTPVWQRDRRAVVRTWSEWQHQPRRACREPSARAYDAMRRGNCSLQQACRYIRATRSSSVGMTASPSSPYRCPVDWRRRQNQPRTSPEAYALREGP